MTTADDILNEVGYLDAARFFEKGRLLPATLSEALMATYPMALTQEHRIAVYANGVYGTDGPALTAAVADILGNRFSRGHRGTVEDFLIGRLYTERKMLPAHQDEALLNLRNGMLDLATGVLKSHDPGYMSSVQLPVAWDPDATCPAYERWLSAQIPYQVDDLEETVATMLDPSRTPTKAAFLFGPSRSGKSTFLRLMAAMAGPENVSAVTLHQLSTNRFAAANVYGKILNSAADISAQHVEDLSIFKMMTGEDMIHADRKYGGQFTFTNRALFAFSANELPTIGESSRAYVERIKPFAFSNSFAGHEDASIEVAMLQELQGILARWVRAYQRLQERGRRLPTMPTVAREFEERSDRVKQWLAECCEITGGETACPGGYLPAHEVTSKRQLAREFNAWARTTGGSAIGERKIFDRLTSGNGVFEVRSNANSSIGLNIRVMTSHLF